MNTKFLTNLATTTGWAVASPNTAYTKLSQEASFALKNLGIDNLPYSLIAQQDVWQLLQQNPNFGQITLIDPDGIPLLLTKTWCSVNGSNQIIRMPVAGRAQTHKQLHSQHDYRIVINGWVEGVDGVYPAEVQSLMNNFLKKGGPHRVLSTYLILFGINNLIISSIQWPGIEGVAGAFRFSMEAYSEPSEEENLSRELL